MLVTDVMSRNVVSVRPNMPTRAAAALLVVHGFTSAPVVTAEGVLRGIVTEADLMRGHP
jgi:CBS domain-containing protein